MADSSRLHGSSRLEWTASRELRSRTASIHERVEKQISWNELLSTETHYRVLLLRLRHIETILGPAIQRQFHTPPAWLSDRRGVPQLDADLGALNSPELSDEHRQSILECDWIRAESHAAGAIYVLEGSTMGGQYLARMVEENLGLTAVHGTSYLSGYGKDTLKRWRRTQAWLDEVITTSEELDDAVESSMKTFRFYASALKGER